MTPEGADTSQRGQSVRRLVFLSHANPADNDITLWLAARLAAAGYEVWSDLTKLIGGERFWATIQEALETHTVKVVSLVSKVSVRADGFLNELSVATSVERELKDPEFVIPCRVDDLEFSKFPAQMHRKNAIDFSVGWHVGLSRLLKKLDDDSVPRSQSDASDQLSLWSKRFLAVDANLARSDETLLTNWLPIVGLPKHVQVSVRDGTVPFVRDAWPWPVAPTIDVGIASFASTSELIPQGGQSPVFVRQVGLQTFVGDDNEARGGIDGLLARRVTVDLLRQAFERCCKARGMIAAEFSNGRLCWYWPVSEANQSPVEYQDLDGTKRKKRVIGRSEKRGVYWHYAVDAIPILAEPPRFALQAHVVFTEDGITPISSDARAHRLRRTFCKNWWQWQWRELMLAFLARLSVDGTFIRMPVGKDVCVELSVQLLRLTAPVSSAVVTTAEEDLDEPLPVAEDADDDVDDEDDADEAGDDDEGPDA